jgi:hypothetical protein
MLIMEFIYLLQIDRVIFCLFLKEDVKIYENLMQVYFPVEDLKTNLWKAEKRLKHLFNCWLE